MSDRDAFPTQRRIQTIGENAAAIARLAAAARDGKIGMRELLERIEKHQAEITGARDRAWAAIGSGDEGQEP